MVLIDSKIELPLEFESTLEPDAAQMDHVAKLARLKVWIAQHRDDRLPALGVGCGFYGFLACLKSLIGKISPQALGTMWHADLPPAETLTYC